MHESAKGGTAAFSVAEDWERAGLLDNGHLHHGFTDEVQPRQIGFDADTPGLVLGPAGVGKLATDLAYKLQASETTIHLDPKGELYAVSACAINEARYCFNPYEMHADAPWFAPTVHSINPLDVADPNRADFFENASAIARNLIAKPPGNSGGNSAHFWGKASQITTSVLMDGKEKNPHFSLPDLYNVIGDLQGGAGTFFLTCTSNV